MVANGPISLSASINNINKHINPFDEPGTEKE